MKESENGRKSEINTSVPNSEKVPMPEITAPNPETENDHILEGFIEVINSTCWYLRNHALC